MEYNKGTENKTGARRCPSLIKQIDELYNQVILDGNKPYKTYYDFEKYLSQFHYQPRLEDLEYLGDLLNCKAGWAKIKYEELLHIFKKADEKSERIKKDLPF